MDEETDPKIVERLKNLPPYGDERDKETPQETPEVPETPPEEPKVEEPTPEVTKEEETKKRTAEQFDKLKESNNKLKEELETVKKKNVLESLMPEAPQPTIYPQPPTVNVAPEQFPGLTQTQIKETFKGLVDENGYVDSGLLIETLKELREKNRIAEERAKIAEQQSQNVARKFDDFQRNEIMKEVHAKYPTLNPENGEFDEKLWKFVRNEVIDQWMNGKQTDVMAAAQEGFDTLHGNDMKKADKEKLEAAETAKKNINALGVNQTSQRESSGDHEALVRATQLGKKGALAERLRKAGM